MRKKFIEQLGSIQSIYVLKLNGKVKFFLHIYKQLKILKHYCRNSKGKKFHSFFPSGKLWLCLKKVDPLNNKVQMRSSLQFIPVEAKEKRREEYLL
jgi:hypothetical protein